MGDSTEPPLSTSTNVPESKVNSALEGRIRKLLRAPSHKVILTIPLECCHARRSRHLVAISAPAIRPCLPTNFSRSDSGRQSAPPLSLIRDSRQCSARVKMDRNSMELDYCLLGVDTWSEPSESDEEPVEVTALGFVCKILWGTSITLDGDGGFRVHVLQRHYIFKPSTLQSLWTAIQTLHAISAKLKPKRNSIVVEDTDWVTDYEAHINSHQSCINEWNEMPDISSRRPMSPDELSVLSHDAADTETKKTVIKSKLREIMRTVDLDDITTKSIRLRLEEDLNEKFDELKAFIDEEILLILGQMDPASRIFDFLFLGSEWNASNLEELNSNGVTHILNITREIDNFFPAVFKYLNIREWDVEETDLLKYWDETYNFIHGAMQMGGKVLVHCKMGISRSASTVCSFAMKYFGWSLTRALSHTKERRGIINPNAGFREQLKIYEGILEASRQRNSFKEVKRSKSEGSMMKKSPTLLRIRRGSRKGRGHSRQGSAGVEVGSEEGQGKHRRASSWSPAQLADEEEGGRRHLVSDSPVDLFGETSGETDHILKNLGNFPIHGRQAAAVAAQQKTSVPISEELSPARELSQQQPNEPPDIDIVGEESESRLLDTSGAEELSVKTLADMFDFRLGEQEEDSTEHIATKVTFALVDEN